MSIVNILDTAGAVSFASADALDLLMAGDRRVVITSQVLREIRTATSSNYVKVQQWLNANPLLWEEVTFNVDQAGLDEYVVPVNGKQSPADASIAKYIEEISDKSQHFELITDNRKDFDGARLYAVPDRVTFERSTAGFIKNVILRKLDDRYPNFGEGNKRRFREAASLSPVNQTFPNGGLPRTTVFKRCRNQLSTALIIRRLTFT